MEFCMKLLATAAFIFLVFLYFALLRKDKTTAANSNSREAPELAGAWPIIGHLHLLGGNDKLLHRTLGAMADKHGPAFNIRLGSQRAFVITSKEVAKECLTGNDRVLASRPATTATKHMCYNHAVFGFAPFSPHWRQMRRIVVSEFLSNHPLQMLKQVQASEVDKGLRKLYGLWDSNSCLPVLADLRRWTAELALSIIVRAVAGKRYAETSAASGDGEAKRCQEAISEFFHLMGIFTVSDAIPSLWWLDYLGHQRAMQKTGKDFDAVLSGWLDEHRRRRALGEVKAEGEQDFIDLMLSLEEEGQLSGFQFDADTSIKSTCVAMIAGGSDTTAATLTWAISLLLNNRAALKKVQEELDLHVGCERPVQESDLKNLVYLQAVVKETLRLHPIAPLSGPREAMEDCTIAGFWVPAGTRVIINAWKIQRDPSTWPDPLAFQPERFLTTHLDIDVRGQHYELLPFGSGRRSCPGSSFALFALHLTLARLLHEFDLATVMDQPVDMTERSGVTVSKATPLEVLLSPRLPAKFYN